MKAIGVPIQEILNANPTYNRRDMGNLEALTWSIEKRGLQIKVLLAANFEIIDGGRRIAALRKLGATEVPAISTDDWLQVHAHMVNTKQLERRSPELAAVTKPLDWDEIYDLYWGVFQRLYEPLRYLEQGNGKRRYKHKYADFLSRYDGGKYSRYQNQVAEMIGVVGSHLANAMRIGVAVGGVKLRRPDRKPQVDEILARLRNTGIEHLHTPLRLITELRDLDDPPAPDRRNAEKQLKLLRSAFQMLDTVSNQMLEIGGLDEAISTEELTKLREELRRTQAKISKTRNKIRARLATEGITEERESAE